MKANELRIGNWILGTPTEHKSQVKPFKVYAETFSDIESSYGIFEPIILTEDILLKCGLNKDPKKHNCIKYHKPYIFNWNNEPLVYFTIYDFEYHATGDDFKGWLIPLTDGDFFMSCKNVHIKYLHQLQNLYFALTGEELEVNL